MRLLMTVLALMLSACGVGSAGSVQAACAEHSNAPTQVCQCIGKKAAALSKAQRAFVAATIAGDQKAAQESQKDMDFSEITTAGTFFLSASADCAEETG